MCGISAVLVSERDTAHVTIARMTGSMNHRGPDATGIFGDEIRPGSYLALGHNRLCIRDRSLNAAQPMRSRDGRFVLSYNGELYNLPEIVQQLRPCERPHGPHGDTEVVLAALCRWGPQALARFNGMWALLLLDLEHKTLLVSRDRFGEKPLYFHHSADGLYFASEIKAILEATQQRFKVDPDAVVPFLTRGIIDHTTETFFRGIHHFPAASYAVVNLLERPVRFPEPQRFWFHPIEKGLQAESGQVSESELRELFIDSVRLRLFGDVPFGLLLSGGLDSSAILGACAHLNALDEVVPLSMVSDNPSVSEERFIDVVARYHGVNPIKVDVSRDIVGLLRRLDDATWFNDGPLAGLDELVQVPLMDAAVASGVKVLLVGQGADEMLGGYNKYFYFYLQSLLRERKYARAAKSLLAVARRTTLLQQFQVSEAIRYAGAFRLAKHTFIQEAHQGRDDLDLGLQVSYGDREWLDLSRLSLPTILHTEDRLSMARSVEKRVPFLDFRLVECLARLHPSEKFKNGWTKGFFREAITGLVPKEIQYRRDKNAFGLPFDEWMRGELKPIMQQMFQGTMRSEEWGFIDRARLCQQYDRFLRRRSFLNARTFFRAYAFETFLRRFSEFLTT